jgi:hypothetical protein
VSSFVDGSTTHEDGSPDAVRVGWSMSEDAELSRPTRRICTPAFLNSTFAASMSHAKSRSAISSGSGTLTLILWYSLVPVGDADVLDDAV